MYLKLLAVAALLFSTLSSPAQDWSFIKEKDGIQLYTSKGEGDILKTFKGVVDIHSTVDIVAGLISDVSNNDWWDENISEVRVLKKEDPKHFQYYLVYDLGWPLSDRDLVVDARVTTDPVTNKYVIYSCSLKGGVPEKKDLIRIREYWQRWTVHPVGKGIVRVMLEGSANPGGSIPAWIVNSIITDTPYKILRSVREKCEGRN